MKDEYLKQLEACKAKNIELEDKLLVAQITTDATKKFWSEHAEKTRKEVKALYERNQWLENRNAEFDFPGARYETLDWLGKIVFIIKMLKRPLRSREIIRELTIRDAREGTLVWLADIDGQFSVVLSKAVKDKRLHSFKMPGTRGFYYSLNEWVDKDGKLSDDRMDELF